MCQAGQSAGRPQGGGYSAIWHAASRLCPVCRLGYGPRLPLLLALPGWQLAHRSSLRLASAPSETYRGPLSISSTAPPCAPSRKDALLFGQAAGPAFPSPLSAGTALG
ncbi:hypothetical protein KIL84_021218 [Mauremys mutica]|uniref:Uncharacterized protein n=1 Tax=Mauremys mutica TaxID=74926 RepID=A0A9D3X703_9SAUR|nr:hypothetical protein KIL84_021218 [Mauremys mutica]